MAPKLKFLVASVAFAFAPISAWAGPVVSTDALREWNLVVLGDLQSSSEVEGRTFVGGNLTGGSSNYQIRAQEPSSFNQPGLTVVGNVTGGIKNLDNASGAIVGGNVESGFNFNGGTHKALVGGTLSNTNINQNQVQTGLATSNPGFLADLNQQKSLLTSSLTDLSFSLGKLDANSQVAINGNRATFNAAPNGDGIAVFSISAAQLDSIGEIQFNLNGADTAIVNVSGTSVRLNDNFLGGTNGLGEHVIWNFAEAETLDLTTAWGGSVLAPKASATTANYIQGSAVFGDLVQNGEMHLGTYSGGYYPPKSPPGGSTGGATEVPGPSTWALFLLALAGLWLWFRRGRKADGAA